MLEVFDAVEHIQLAGLQVTGRLVKGWTTQNLAVLDCA